jgi:hypothetical protein
MIILDWFPLWAVYIVTVVLALIATEIGFRIGLWLRSRDTSLGESHITSSLVGGMLGLLAFLLALSVVTVVGQHNGRKAMVITDANAIGTAYLRAGFLDEPDRNLSRDLLREYVEVRLAAATDVTLLESTMRRSEEIHAQLWSIVEDNVRQGKNSAIMALYVDSINEVIDVHSLRFAAANLRLPRRLGIMLYVAIVLSFMLLGGTSGRDGKRIPPLALLLFALAFVAIFVIIVDLDRPQQGFVTVSQTALSDLLQQMTTSGP